MLLPLSGFVNNLLLEALYLKRDIKQFGTRMSWQQDAGRVTQISLKNQLVNEMDFWDEESVAFH